jgi:SAM-dependent methyltransferase
VTDDWHCPDCGYAPAVSDGFRHFAPNRGVSDDDFDPEAFGRLAALEEGSFWFRARNRLIVQALQRWFPAMKSFLEIGCGSGFVLRAVAENFPQAAVAGSEVLAAGLPHARTRVPRAALFQADGRTLPYSAEFDVVGAFDVLEHVTDDDCFLAGMFDAVRPGGGMVVTVPQHRFLWSEADRFARHKRRYARRDLIEKVTEAGFEILQWTSSVALLLPLLLMSRLRSRVLPRTFDPWAEFALPGWLDRILEAIMTIELSMVRRGFVFPAGGSLLLVARKPTPSGRSPR